MYIAGLRAIFVDMQIVKSICFWRMTYLLLLPIFQYIASHLRISVNCTCAHFASSVKIFQVFFIYMKQLNKYIFNEKTKCIRAIGLNALAYAIQCIVAVFLFCFVNAKWQETAMKTILCAVYSVHIRLFVQTESESSTEKERESWERNAKNIGLSNDYFLFSDWHPEQMSRLRVFRSCYSICRKSAAISIFRSIESLHNWISCAWNCTYGFASLIKSQNQTPNAHI